MCNIRFIWYIWCISKGWFAHSISVTLKRRYRREFRGFTTQTVQHLLESISTNIWFSKCAIATVLLWCRVTMINIYFKTTWLLTCSFTHDHMIIALTNLDSWYIMAEPSNMHSYMCMVATVHAWLQRLRSALPVYSTQIPVGFPDSVDIETAYNGWTIRLYISLETHPGETFVFGFLCQLWFYFDRHVNLLT